MGVRGPHPLFHAIVSMGAVVSQPACGGVERGSLEGGGAVTGATGGARNAGGEVTGATGGARNAGGAVTATGGASNAGGAVSFGASSSGGTGAKDAGASRGPRNVYVSDAGVCPAGTQRDCTMKTCVCRGDVLSTECRDPAEYTCGFLSDGCYCNPDAPHSPSDCERTNQFSCDEWTPAATGCRCDTSAPGSASECPPCAGFSCHSYEPPVDCRCVICIR